MRNSDRKMNEKLKAVIAMVLFLAAVIVISVLIFLPYKKVWSKDNHYDTLFIGASRTYKGIQPNLVDADLGCNSYLMASDSCRIEERYMLVQSALEQGTLKTVVLEISVDALTDSYETMDNAYIFLIEPMSKLEGLGRKLNFCAERFNFWNDDYDNVYPTMLDFGLVRWDQNMRGWQEEKGYIPFGQIPMGESAETAAETHDSIVVNDNYLDRKKEAVEKIIELCQENGIRIVIINTPDTEIFVWQHYGWEAYEDYMNGVAEKYGIEKYDFNLLKDRQQYFDDNLTFTDYTHLCEDGSAIFSPLMADILRRGESEDLSYMFYDSYEEAKTHSVYAVQ